MEIRNFYLFGLRNVNRKYMRVAQKKQLERAWQNKIFVQRWK